MRGGTGHFRGSQPGDITGEVTRDVTSGGDDVTGDVASHAIVMVP